MGKAGVKRGDPEKARRAAKARWAKKPKPKRKKAGRSKA